MSPSPAVLSAATATTLNNCFLPHFNPSVSRMFCFPSRLLWVPIKKILIGQLCLCDWLISCNLTSSGCGTRWNFLPFYSRLIFLSIPTVTYSSSPARRNTVPFTACLWFCGQCMDTCACPGFLCLGRVPRSRAAGLRGLGAHSIFLQGHSATFHRTSAAAVPKASASSPSRPCCSPHLWMTGIASKV